MIVRRDLPGYRRVCKPRIGCLCSFLLDRDPHRAHPGGVSEEAMHRLGGGGLRRCALGKNERYLLVT